jgi:hypothetical protein
MVACVAISDVLEHREVSERTWSRLATCARRLRLLADGNEYTPSLASEITQQSRVDALTSELDASQELTSMAEQEDLEDSLREIDDRDKPAF